MNQMQQLAQSVPHEYREKILLQWLPNAEATLRNDSMRLLFEAWFIYIEPNGVKKSDCPICISTILDNWRLLKPYLVATEQEHNLLEQL